MSNQTPGSVRHIINIDLIRQGPATTDVFTVEGCTFHLTRYNLGWDFETARAMVEKFDGHVDAIALSGVHASAHIGDLELTHKASQQLISSAHRTPVFTAGVIRDFFAEWTLSRLLKRNPNLIKGRRVLCHAAVLTPCLERMDEAGANITAADLLTMLGLPVRLQGLTNLRRSFTVLKRALEFAPPSVLKPFGDTTQPALQSRLRSWLQDSDVFVTFSDLIDNIGTFDVLEGKTVLIDTLSPETDARLKAAGVAKILKLMPDFPKIQPHHVTSFSVFHAIIDQLRQLEDGGWTMDEYLFRFIEKHGLQPGKIEVLSPSINRCAFIVHPLVRSDLLRAPQLRWLQRAPERAQRLIEKALANHAPAINIGSISGITSINNGQKVICDIYALPATPRQLLDMDEKSLYDRLVHTAEVARANGAAIIGLGAYTKVVGDAGITVARRASIPVTNGNSYSAASTLWAAREMVIKMGFVTLPETGKRLNAKAMVIGATGSIGRVSAHLLALAYNQIVLVATRPGRLLELRDEIMAFAPGVDVKIRTDSSSDLPDSDLIVTATSNQSGKILDIEMVKPGAVICDCSRPLDISQEEAALRPDVMIIESGEIDLPGNIEFTCDIGLPEPSVYACLAETVLLSLEGKLESFSLGKELSLHKVKEIYKLGLKHGAKLSEIRGPNGMVTDEAIDACRRLATERLKYWSPSYMAHARRIARSYVRPDGNNAVPPT